MAVLYFFACVFRPICLPLPEILIISFGRKYCSGMTALIIGLTGSVIGIIGMYLLSSIFADKLINILNFKEKVAKFHSYIEKYSTGIIGVFFVLPVFPDIVIGLGAAAMKVRLHEYLILAIISKIVTIGMVVYSKEIAGILMLKTWHILVFEFAFMEILAIIFQKLEKHKSFFSKKTMIE